MSNMANIGPRISLKVSYVQFDKNSNLESVKNGQSKVAAWDTITKKLWCLVIATSLSSDYHQFIQ